MTLYSKKQFKDSVKVASYLYKQGYIDEKGVAYLIMPAVNIFVRETIGKDLAKTLNSSSKRVLSR